MPKVKRPKKGWSIPKAKRKRPTRSPAAGKRLPRCPSCGQWSMKRDDKRSETYCLSCGLIGQ